MDLAQSLPGYMNSSILPAETFHIPSIHIFWDLSATRSVQARYTYPLFLSEALLGCENDQGPVEVVSRIRDILSLVKITNNIHIGCSLSVR